MTVLVYDVFSAADTVSASSGGTFSGAVTHTGAFTSVGIDDNADATTMTIDTSENVGIGNTSPSSQYMTRLVVGDGSGTEGITIYSGNDSSGRLEFSDATSGDGRYAGGIVYEHNNNKLRFNTNGGNERLGIDSGGDVTINAGDLIFGASGKGINLGVTSNTDANTLDDYEEGTFTAQFTNFSGSATFSNAVYVKIGQMVFFTLHITGKSNTSDGDQMTVSGFPFAVLGEHPASVGMNDNEFGHAMVNTAEYMYFYNLTGGHFTYDMFPHTSGYARIQGAYRIA